ncbi:MAG: beta-N-acetylglucosaminidase domain-containing protein [Thermosynechococcaceae cyanobacterium]
MGFETGIIEGFFGRPWGWQVRRDYASFLVQNHYCYYIYAPKADRILRQDWSGQWSAQAFKQLQHLGQTYHQAGLSWGLGLNLFELHCDYDTDAIATLEAKILYLNQLQPDILAILFDDMQGGGAEMAQIQADITHRVMELTTASTIFMCPTYYSSSSILDRLFGPRPADYLESLGRLLDSAIQIFWTGPEICSAVYPESHLKEVGQQLGRKPYLWDNYPVNDSDRMCKFLHLRAFEHRPPQLADWTAGIAANPMNQAYLSQIPLMTLAMSLQQQQYEPAIAFSKAAQRLCGDQFTDCLSTDLKHFQDQGLEQLASDLKAQLIQKYQAFATPYGEEIVGWLRGEYPYSLDCLTE